MTDFNILHGLSTELFTTSGEINSNLIIEDGCWYLCTDTAELFLGTYKLDEAGLPVVNEVTGEKVLTLKKINASIDSQITNSITRLEIVDGSLIATYADGSITDLGKVVDSIPTKVSDLINDAGYITAADVPNVDLRDYALKSEIPSVSDFITSIPSDYITESELNEKGYLTEHQDLSGKADKEHNHDEYANKIHAHEEYATAEHTHIEYLTQHQDISHLALKTSIPTKISQLTNDSSYLTSIPSEYVTEAELSGYALKSEIPDITGKANAEHTHEEYANKEHIHTEYADTEHTHEGYLTEHQSLANYYNKDEVNNLIPSLDGYATEEYVLNAIENHEALAAVAEVKTKLEEEVIPTVEHTILPKVEKIDEILPTVQTLSNTKADKVLFTTSAIVNNAVGSFEVGEDLKDLTLAQLFVRLLGLSDKPNDNPDEPEIPDVNATPEEIVDYLISTKTAMYSQDTQGNLVETAFTSNTWTVPEASVQMDGISTVYRIVDEAGNIIESGYQEATDYNEEAWLTIALPDIITNVKVKMYNPGTSNWEDVNWKVVPADEQTIEGYTIWTVPETYEVMSGDTYRFVIIN